MSAPNPSVPIQSTAGAIPLKNEKGELYMQKVKVQRYVAGKRPDYAVHESSDEDDVEFGMGHKKTLSVAPLVTESDVGGDDRRLRRLQERHRDDDDEDDTEVDRVQRHRRLHEPEVIAEGSEEEEGETRDEAMEDSDEEEELDEEEIERRRHLIKEKARQQREEEELMEKEEEKPEGSEEESSEYEEYTDSEEEETGPRLKPVFVRKKDRVTIQEKEREAQRKKELEREEEKRTEDRKRQTVKLLADELRKEHEEEKGTKEDEIEGLDSEEENDEEEYETWKLRELKRMKRDRDERDTIEKERQDVERVRNMTEEERRAYFKSSQGMKTVTNKATKGKYKFLQKYYHRGAFFMDNEEDVYKRDFTAPTLEDHFEKTILPKVMQVKNFGRSGRTKYTHLVDQDTTSFDMPWAVDTSMNLKFQTAKGGGMKQVFDRPTSESKKK